MVVDEEHMAYPVGIDLGTTNSVVCVWRRGNVETIPGDSELVMPSAISVRPDGSVLIGRTAKARLMVEPLDSVISAKRNIGDGKTVWKIHGKSYTPMDVSAIILKRMKEAAELYLKEKVSEAVITVPAYFNNNQKRDTKAAGEAAGLKVLQLLPEPTAAAVSYGLDKGKDQTIMVYDLGGGTFDVSILSVRGNQFRVVAVDGDFNLGGDDFDLLIVELLMRELQKKSRADMGLLDSLFKKKRRLAVASTDMLKAQGLLKEAAEKAKKELSESDATTIIIPQILDSNLEVELTLAAYNKMITPLVDKTVGKVRDVLKAARMSPDDIDRVILVGGSTRNRLVKQWMTETVKEPWIADRVDEMVAQGAAIVAGSLFLPEEDMTPIEFSNVTPHSLGVRATRGSDTDYFQIIISKNSSLPTENSFEFTTFQRNQKAVEVSVFQGEANHCKKNTFIGGFRLDGIPPAPAKQPKIIVKFNMDNSDLLNVTASCSNLSSEKILDVNMISQEDSLLQSGGLSRVDIMFLIDTSGSMSLELEGVKKSCLEFANRVLGAGVDCRIGLVDFDKHSWGNYNVEVFGPMKPAKFPSAITGLKIGRLGGCGCYIGETNTIPVIEKFIKSFPKADNRLKIGILISDEVGNDAMAIKDILNLLQAADICLHVVGVAYSCHEKLASVTGGKFWDIHASRGHIDFGDLLDVIATEITHLALC